MEVRRTATTTAIVFLSICCALRAAEMTTLHMDENCMRALKSKFARPAVVPFPAGNAWTQEREELGRMLFFDPRLSGSGAISCATCHNPAFGWDDGLAKAVGHGSKQLTRKTPTIVNAAWGQRFFWDGRADSLEEQALGPIQSAGEMNLPIEKLRAVVRSIGGYQPLFQRAYPGEPMDERTIAKAIATFERTLVSAEAPFDRWVKGDEHAISDSAKRGFLVFNGKAMCAECHSGWEFTDHGFHNVGTFGDDPGRGKFDKADKMQHAFNTPGLRNVAKRAAFMHDGSEPTLESVIDFYDKGGMCALTNFSPETHPLSLTPGEKRELLNFLATLTSDDPRVQIPALPGRDDHSLRSSSVLPTLAQ